MDEETLAGEFARVLGGFEGQPILKRLKIRLNEADGDRNDEVAQFRQLQRACRESAELDAALTAAGLGPLQTMNPRDTDPKVGALVNAFNRFLEANWR